MNFKSKVIKFSAAVVGALALGTAFAATNASADEIYTVQAGDTLSGISYKYANNTSLVDTLAQNNNIADKNLIIVGQQLMITSDGQIRKATEQEVETTPAASESTTTSSDSSSSASASTSSSSNYTSSVTGDEAAAKAAIAARESGGSYTAQNGQYYGKYQLSSSYLNGDYSSANQEATADSYVASRYGSWSAALAHSNATGWY